MRRISPVAVACAIALGTVSAADASVQLIAIGSLTGSSAGSYADLSGLTGTLENGAPANLLGGIGSGLAYAGGNTFIGLPDRGPNAVSYTNGGLVDNTTSYIERFQTINMSLTPASSGSLPYTLTPTLSSTTLLYSSTALNYGTGVFGSTSIGSGVPGLNQTNGHYYFTGRSDGFASGSGLTSLNANNARLDPESVRLSNDGKSVFVSDEYGPYVYQFNRATGERIRTFDLPANLGISNLSSVGDTEISGNTVGRVANKGMEGLAITPDGKTLVGIMQAQLEQDKNNDVRIVTIDIASGATHEYAYHLTTGSGVSDIVAINDHQFLVDERDGKGLGDKPNNPTAAAVKQVFSVDITGATDISGMGNLATASYTPVSKGASAWLDVKAALVAAGIDPKLIPSKIEGLAFGQDVVINGVTEHTLYIANDNDFLSTLPDPNNLSGTVANPNNFYVFAFKDGDLPGFQAQSFSAVPLPGALPLFGSALAALAALRRRRNKSV